MFVLYNSSDKNLDIFYKFLILLCPIISIILIYFIVLTIYYCLVKKIIRINNLDIDIIKEKYNIFSDSYILYNSIKHISSDEELTLLFEESEIQQMNIHNFDIIYGDRFNNEDNISYGSDNNGENCVICLEDINNKISTNLECEHKFHIMCLNQWVSKSNKCPLCNANIM